MIRDPRAAFDQLFGVGATPEQRAQRRRRPTGASSTGSPAKWRGSSKDLGAGRIAPASISTSTEIREIERRIQKSRGAATRSGEPRELPDAPMGVPDSFDEHVKLMFDLQALAFASDITRVFSFKMGRDGSSARLSRERRARPAFHPASHHGEREDRDHRLREDQQVPRQPGAVLPREAEGHAGRRRQPARQHAGDLRLADGQLEHAQPQALPAVPRRPRRRRARRATCTSRRPTARRWPTRCCRCCTCSASRT